MIASGVHIPAGIAETIVDASAYADDRIHDAYRWLRRHLPLGIAEPHGFDPFWVVTRYADIQHVSVHNDLFHSADRSATLVNQASDRLTREVTGGCPHLWRSLTRMDGEEHAKMRRVTQAWFTPANVQKLEPRIRQIARQTIDRMLDKGGHCDFVKEIAAYYPLRIIMEILGIPEIHEREVLELTHRLTSPMDPERSHGFGGNPAAGMSLSLQETTKAFETFFSPLSNERRAHPGEDLMSVIANAKIDGAPIPEHEELSYYMTIGVAGHDTTASCSAGAIWGLADNPDQFEQLKENPGMIPALVEEAIRWTTPAKHFMRTATADCELGGRSVRRRDWLMLCYASANRDEDVFEQPMRFRIDRDPAPRHLAFGYGGHLCLGQHLARMELRILFEELLPRLRSVTLDGTPTVSLSTFINGPKSLPIRFEVDPTAGSAHSAIA